MDLHGRIMNIADKVTTNTNAMAGNDAFLAYKEGHRDARHASAELVLKVDALVAAARAVLAFRVDTPARGDLRDNDASRAALRALAAAVVSIGDA